MGAGRVADCQHGRRWYWQYAVQFDAATSGFDDGFDVAAVADVDDDLLRANNYCYVAITAGVGNRANAAEPGPLGAGLVFNNFYYDAGV